MSELFEHVEQEAKDLVKDVESFVHPAPEPAPTEPAPTDPSPASEPARPSSEIEQLVQTVLTKLAGYKTSHPAFAEFDRAIDLMKVVADTLARVTEVL